MTEVNQNRGFDNEDREFILRVRQQPERARLCSFKEENDTIDRRPVDPPPVVQLLTPRRDPATIFESTNYFLRASIVHPTPTTLAHGEEDYLPVKTATGADATAGETVQTPERLKGLDGIYGALVIFAKLSVRVPGTFRLKFTLYDTTEQGIEEITSTVSEPFEVFSPKLFKGMKESTPLTRHLASQGLKVKLRTDTTVGRQSDSRKRSSHSVISNRQTQTKSAPASLSPPHGRHAPLQSSAHASSSRTHLRHPMPVYPSSHAMPPASSSSPLNPTSGSYNGHAPLPSFPPSGAYRSAPPPPPPGPSLVWHPHYNNRYPDASNSRSSSPVSSPFARFGRDDGIPSIRDVVGRHDYALATPPASDLSAFSLSNDSRRNDSPLLSNTASSSRTASGSRTFSPFPSTSSSMTPATSASSDSPGVLNGGATLPPLWGNISLNIPPGDDGLPVLPAFLRSTTQPVLPPPLPSFLAGSSHVISPPPLLPPLRHESGNDPSRKR